MGRTQAIQTIKCGLLPASVHAIRYANTFTYHGVLLAYCVSNASILQAHLM